MTTWGVVFKLSAGLFLAELEKGSMSDKPLTSEQKEFILDAIQSMGGTIVNIKRYPPGSSIIKMALEKGLKSFEAIFADHNSFTVSENERQLLINDELMPEKVQVRGYVAKFVQSMVERNIRSFSFKKGLTDDELTRFIELLGQRPEDLKEQGDLPALLTAANVTHVSVDEKVFVALTKGQTVADIAELEQLAKTRDGSVTADNFKEGVFVQYLLSKLPIGELNISDQKVNELKQQIDYEKIKAAKDVDFEKIAPIMAATFERWSQDVESFETGAAPLPRREARAQVAGDEIAASISPELFEALRRADTTLATEAADQSRDERVQKLTDTFEHISRVIYSFKEPGIRAKLLGNFLKIVTNFKSMTLAQLLSTRFAEGVEGEADLKNQILASLSAKKKSAIVDLFITRYRRIFDGLNPADFEFNPLMIEETERILQRIHQSTQEKELVEKTKRAMNLVRTIRQEVTDPEKLLILKVRRLITKDPPFFLEDQVQTHLPDMIVRLIDMNRADVAKKLIEKVFANLASDDPAIRLKVAGAVVRVSQELLDVGNTSFHGQLYNQVLRAFRQEKEKAIYAAFLATLVSDLGRLVASGNLPLVAQVFKSVNNLRSVEADPTKKQFLAMCEKKIADNQSMFDYLVDRFTNEDDVQSETAFKILLQIDQERVVPLMFRMLQESPEMRVRKRVMSALTHFEQPVGPAVREQLQQTGLPWYYVRNLIMLAGELKDVECVPLLGNFLAHEHQQVQKAALSTLVKLGGDEANRLLAAALPKLDPSSQRLLFVHFGNARSEAALDLMLNRLDPTLPEKDESLAIDLITALGRIGKPAAVAAIKKIIRPGRLGGLFGGKVNEKVLLVSLKALGEIGGAEAKDLIDKFVRSGKPAIAKAAQVASMACKA